MIRRALPEDAEALRRIEVAALAPGWTTDQILGTLNDAHSLVLIFEMEGQAKAYVSFRFVVDEAELLRLGVVPAARRLGIARALLNTAAGQLIDVGVRDLFLEVRADNFSALAFYGTTGWRAVGSRRGYYLDGVDAVLMRSSTRVLASATV